MKKYSPKIAAKLLVVSHAQHGLSRHTHREMASSTVVSVLTEKAHCSALTLCANWLLKTKGKHLKNLTKVDAMEYLETRAETCKQSAVSLGRQAINLHILGEDPVNFVASKIPHEPKNRAYSNTEIDLLVWLASPEMALSILLAVDAGLRDMELLTISHAEALHPSARDWSADRFCARENDVPFVVWGKGGLRREVRVSPNLAAQLEATAREHPQRVSNRGAFLTSHFDLVGGHRFSIEFGKLSKFSLGFSHGSHGLRHTFAQRRRDHLICSGHSMESAILILSQELGHFHCKNTMAYLRDTQL